jgi:proline racemase
MRFSRLLSTIDVHAGGEIGRVVTSGIMGLPGGGMADKMRYINEVDDSLRRFLVTKPRASAAMTTNLLLPPTRTDADAAFLVLQIDRAHAMSGSNAMCVVTALLETGMVAMREPETVVRLDTPAGLVVARAECGDGCCRGVSLDMTPSFAGDLDVRLVAPNFGTVTGDVAFGGVFYFLVDAQQVGLTITPANARGLVAIGIEILAAANKALDRATSR